MATCPYCGVTLYGMVSRCYKCNSDLTEGHREGTKSAQVERMNAAKGFYGQPATTFLLYKLKARAVEVDHPERLPCHCLFRGPLRGRLVSNLVVEALHMGYSRNEITAAWDELQRMTGAIMTLWSNGEATADIYGIGHEIEIASTTRRLDAEALELDWNHSR